MKVYDDVLDKQFLDYINHTLSLMRWELHNSSPNQKTPLFFNSITLDENTRHEDYLFLFNIKDQFKGLLPLPLGRSSELPC